MIIRYFPAADLPPKSWKNGGGLLRELSIGPAGADLQAFDWRISLADIAPGEVPFSYFAGIDRLTRFTGAGMTILRPGRTAPLQPYELLRVRGEGVVQGRLDGASLQAFNLMVRRGAAAGEIEVFRQSGGRVLDCDLAVLHCMQGAATVTLPGGSVLALCAADTLELSRCRSVPIALTCTDAETIVLAAWVRLARPDETSTD